jgi:hypothetical protein
MALDRYGGYRGHRLVHYGRRDFQQPDSSHRRDHSHEFLAKHGFNQPIRHLYADRHRQRNRPLRANDSWRDRHRQLERFGVIDIHAEPASGFSGERRRKRIGNIWRLFRSGQLLRS